MLGSTAAIAAALVLARWRPLGNALVPYLIAANAIPVIAFAPITNAWFGTLSPWSKVVIAAALCFFPVLVNTLRGLTSVHPSSIELMHSYAAPERAIFWKLRIPASLPFLFTALKVAAVLAMIGAVVGDYFGGSTESLGVQIQSAVALSRYELGWAAIIVASLHRDGAVRRGRPRRAVRRPLASIGAVGRLGRCTDVIGIGTRHNQGGSMKKRWVIVAALAAAVAALAVVGLADRRLVEVSEATKVTVQLKWVTQAQFAGFYAAQAKGYYKQAGLDVNLKLGGPGHRPRAGRARRTGGVRGRLAAEPLLEP